MLTEITIENLAIVDRVRLQLDRGFNVLTGETGAGKSIIIDAVQAVLGGRCSADMVRTGTDRAVVEAQFESLPNTAMSVLSSLGFECDSSSELIITREIHASGRSVARVNGRLATLQMLREITRNLVDIHGQGEHQTLLDSSKHLLLLDSFAGSKALSLRREVGSIYHELQAARREYERLSDAKERARAIDLLSFQVAEINDARLSSGEEALLLEERRILAAALRLLETATSAYSMLYEGRRGEAAAADQIERSLQAVSEALDTDPRLSPAVNALREASAWIEEAVSSLRDYKDSVRPDPERLDQIEERLSLIAHLKRKYGDAISDILKFKQKAEDSLRELQNADENAALLLQKARQLALSLKQKASALSQLRHDASNQIAQMVSGELSDLGMKNTQFEVSLSGLRDSDTIEVDGETLRISASGSDAAEFLMSGNPGEPTRPLSKVASGGEMSRVMLALKSVLARADGIPTLIFDEVDAGVGGQTAYTLGEKLALLSTSGQVLCVTHLAQVASYADRHLAVYKRPAGDRTVTQVDVLDEPDRVREISRMLGGDEGKTSMQHAEEMLSRALTKKQKARSAVSS